MSRTNQNRAQRLSAETARTAETLKAWVAEAARVQSRLAESLERCPTVAQTHPVESLHRLATLADRLDTLDADSTRTSQAPVVDSPAVDSPRRARVPTTTANPPAVENPLLGGGPGRARTRALTRRRCANAAKGLCTSEADRDPRTQTDRASRLQTGQNLRILAEVAPRW